MNDSNPSQKDKRKQKSVKQELKNQKKKKKNEEKIKVKLLKEWIERNLPIAEFDAKYTERKGYLSDSSLSKIWYGHFIVGYHTWIGNHAWLSKTGWYFQ